jgi:hypothetical protein
MSACSSSFEPPARISPGHRLIEDAIREIPNYFFSIEIPPLPMLISTPVVFCRSW